MIHQTDNIDFLLTLEPGGWSTCVLLVKGLPMVFETTHTFGDPYYDLMQALSGLIRGENEVFFFWYGEPIGVRFLIKRNLTQQHKVIVSIQEFDGAPGEEPKWFDLKIAFEIKLKQLVTIFYFELLKTKCLLKDTQFASSRSLEFPAQAFYQFENLVKPYLNIE